MSILSRIREKFPNSIIEVNHYPLITKGAGGVRIRKKMHRYYVDGKLIDPTEILKETPKKERIKAGKTWEERAMDEIKKYSPISTKFSNISNSIYFETEVGNGRISDHHSKNKDFKFYIILK